MSEYDMKRAEMLRTFWSKVHRTPSCWFWGGRLLNGYGIIQIYDREKQKQKAFRPHRLAYEFCKGPIPPGLVIDHLCRNPACVNPAHLEAVTMLENLRRGAWTGGVLHASRVRQSAQQVCP